jgi:hypothetical protein
MTNSEADDVLRLILNRENKNIDFKIAVDLSHDRFKNRLAQDVVSFANVEGGTIIVGVDDKTRKIIGIAAPLDHDQIVQSITDLTDPPVDVSIDTIEIEGRLVGLIKIQRGKAVHQLRKERTVYLRRDGINYKATPDEIAQLLDERDFSSRVYLSEPYKCFSSDNSVVTLSGEVEPYRKIAKKGGLDPLAECPVFLPEFSRWISAPEFGDTKGSLMVSYPGVGYIKHNDFIAQVSKVENQLSSLARYLEFGIEGVLDWSISSDGAMCYGRGSESLLKALDNGELGAISITTCGEFRGSTHQRSFLLLISGYCKSRQQYVTFVKDWEIRLYLSTLPVSNAWVRALFSPFLDENTMPFSLLSYELVHPRLRVWRSVVGPTLIVPIKGVIGRYKIDSGDYQAIGAAIADTQWFNPKYYKVETEWQGGNASRDQAFSERLFKTIDNDRRIMKCPIELLPECAISLTNPVPSYEDIESGDIRGIYLPLIKHLELNVIGHKVHVLGLNASPRNA